jgi:hypothetical protein
MIESCSNCRLWKKKTSLTGFCCAHPPVRVDAGLSSFPTSGADTWCGEYQPGPPTAKKPVDKSVPPS